MKTTPSVTRVSPRSFHVADLDHLREALLDLGARTAPHPLAECWRLNYLGGLLMAYDSGKVVLGGAKPEGLAEQLDAWAAEASRRDMSKSSLFDMLGAAPGRKGVRQ